MIFGHKNIFFVKVFHGDEKKKEKKMELRISDFGFELTIGVFGDIIIWRVN